QDRIRLSRFAAVGRRAGADAEGWRARKLDGAGGLGQQRRAGFEAEDQCRQDLDAIRCGRQGPARSGRGGVQAFQRQEALTSAFRKTKPARLAARGFCCVEQAQKRNLAPRLRLLTRWLESEKRPS